MRIVWNIWEYLKNFFVKSPAKARKKYVKRSRTIKKTLDNLDVAFADLTKSFHSQSWEMRASAKQLIALGPYVPPPLDGLNVGKIDLDKLPSILFVAPGWQGYNTKRVINPSFVYCVRQNRTPPHCEPTKHTLYRVGMCFDVSKTKSKNGSMFWQSFYAGIDENGIAHLLRWNVSKTVALPSRKGGYIKRDWEYPKMLDDPEQNRVCGEKEYREFIHMCFNFWATRNKMWTIHVKKGGKRMTFCVDVNETKHYFKDRAIVTNEAGNRKKIIHFVHGHKRKTKNAVAWVREHIRGEREFDWNGYNCNVKAPRYKGFTLDEWDMAESEYGADEETPPKMIGPEKVTPILEQLLDDPQQNAYSTYRKVAPIALRKSA